MERLSDDDQAGRQGARMVQQIREKWAESEVRITSRQRSRQRKVTDMLQTGRSGSR